MVEKCKCRILTVGCDEGVIIDYCPLHKSAPDLYEALKNFIWDSKQGAMPTKEDIEFAEKILAKVEGK